MRALGVFAAGFFFGSISLRALFVIVIVIGVIALGAAIFALDTSARMAEEKLQNSVD